MDVGELPHLQRLFVPLVADARQRLQQQVDASLYNLLTDQAHASWDRYLIKRLHSAGKKVVAQQFQTFYSARSAFAKTRTDQPSNEESARREFVGSDPTERLRKILDEFPGLARLSDILIRNWVSTVSEFLERLKGDLAGLPHQIGDGAFCCPVEDLQAGLSDPHRGGRCVVRVKFSCSTRLIYKPRSLAPEARFSSLLETLNVDDPPYDFRSARCWNRGTYGWMEDVVPEPCVTLTQLRAFYWRAGVLLALIYLARGVDMHRENLIAAGEHPVLIDLETLWHPQEHVGVAKNPLANSVLRTGFLPLEDPSVGVTYEQSGLSRRMQGVGRTLPPTHHLPTFEGIEQPVPPFLSEVLAGFEWTGRQVFETQGIHHLLRKRLLEFKGCPRRQIIRSTAQYRITTERLIAPPSLRTREWGDDTHSERLVSDGSALEEVEWQALQELDLPYVKQVLASGHEQDGSLPVQNLEDFCAQKSFIIRAFFTGSEPRESTD